MILYMKTSEM